MKKRFLTSKDYAKLFIRAKKILDREMSKPSAEWDEALISECEETMLYCAERKKVLYSEEKQNRKCLPSFKLRKAFIAVIAVLATLALSATAAQAAGFRVWSALIHWDINYLRVDYTGNPTEDPTDVVTNNDKTPIEEVDSVSVNFDSYDALVAYMKGKVLFSSMTEEMQFISATLTEDEDMALLHSWYMLEGENVGITVTIPKSPDEDTVYLGNIDYSEFDAVYTKEICGTECIFGTKEEKTHCIFTYNYSMYKIICNAGSDEAVSIVQSLLKGGV